MKDSPKRSPKGFEEKTFRRLVHVNNLLINDEPTDENMKAYMIVDPNMKEFYSRITSDKKLYDLNYNKDECEDKEMKELMIEDANFGSHSKEINRMLARNHIVSKYNKKFRLTNKTRQWNIQF